jgi:hypothetical protein
MLLLPGLESILALVTLLLLYMTGRGLHSFLENGWVELRF